MAKSAFEGAIPSFEDDPEALRRAQARGVSKMFNRDFEGMRSSYEAGRQAGDPTSAQMQSRLAAADEAAMKLMRKRHYGAEAEENREKARFERQRKTNMGAGAGRGFINPPNVNPDNAEDEYKKGGKIKGYAKGGSVSSASKRADGIAQRFEEWILPFVCKGDYALNRLR